MVQDTIGELLRTIRKRRKMTLEQLSERTGISVSSLSRIENTQLGLTLEKIELLAAALEVPAAELVSGGRSRQGASPARRKTSADPGAARFEVGRARGRRETDYRDVNTKFLFDRNAERSLECMQYTIQPVSIWDSEFVRHPGEKIVYILRGTAVMYCQNRSPVVLEPGDALFMDAEVWHSIVAVNDEPAELLVTYHHGPDALEGMFETQNFTPESWSALQTVSP